MYGVRKIQWNTAGYDIYVDGYESARVSIYPTYVFKA